MRVDMKFTKLPNGFLCYYQHWFPENPKALIIMVHGLGDHIGRYNEFVSFLSLKGYACAAFDQRGHGLSEGRRGHIVSIEKLLDDLGFFYDFTIKSLGKDIPVFLLGGSLGGLVVLNFAVKGGKDLRGVVAACPAIKSLVPIPNWQKKIARVVAKVAPPVTVFNKLEFTQLSRDRDEIEAIEKDILFHRRISVGSAIDIDNNLRTVMTLAGRIYCPVIVLSGSKDSICDPRASKDFVERLASSDKKYLLYEGMFHDILHDVGRKKVMEDVELWFRERI